jgi:hypothetical protein
VSPRAACCRGHGHRPSRLHKLREQVAIAIERCLDRSERFGRSRQPKVGRIRRQAFSRRLQGFEGFVAAKICFGQFFTGVLHATAGDRRRVSRSQRFIGGSPAPFLVRGAAVVCKSVGGGL